MTKIYYFSGTGNSLWSAKQIAKAIENSGSYGSHGKQCELFNIGIEAQKEEKIIEADTVIFVFPVYALGPPLIVRNFIKNSIIKAQYAAAFATFGSNCGGALGIVRWLLKKKDIAKMYFGRIPSVENFIAMFGPPKERTLRRQLPKQEKATEAAIQAVIEQKENKVNTFRPFSRLLSFIFYLGLKFLYKRYRVSEDCTGCAMCKKICPVSAITMKDGKPIFSGKCEQCQGCIDICPLRAIRLGRKRFGTPGYHHPKIDVAEF